MAADPESTSWIASALAAIGVGGGGGLLGLHTRASNHDARIKRLEDDREKDSDQIKATNDTVIRLDGRTERIEGDITSILGLLRGGD